MTHVVVHRSHVHVPSAKERLYDRLVEVADHKGRVATSTKRLSIELGIPDHDVVKMLWALQKQNKVTFREAAKTIHNKSGTLTHIRVVKKGAI